MSEPMSPLERELLAHSRALQTFAENEARLIRQLVDASAKVYELTGLLGERTAERDVARQRQADAEMRLIRLQAKEHTAPRPVDPETEARMRLVARLVTGEVILDPGDVDARPEESSGGT